MVVYKMGGVSVPELLVPRKSIFVGPHFRAVLEILTVIEREENAARAKQERFPLLASE